MRYAHDEIWHKPIDRNTYGNVEWHLHNTSVLKRGITQRRADVLFGSVGVDYNTPTGHSKHADSTAHKALKLADENNASKWLKAIKKTYAYYDGKDEAAVMQMFYFTKPKPTIKAIAEKTDIDERTIGRLRDHVVYRCAMFAAADNLIKLD